MRDNTPATRPLIAALSLASTVVLLTGLMTLAWYVAGDSQSNPPGVSTVSAAQGSGQWIPQAQVPFLVSGSSPATPDSYNTYSSGRVSSIAVDPRDPSRWLVGVGNGGVWETRDGGGTFTPLTDDAPTLATGAVAFAPSNPDVVYVATGESGWSVGVGILKSTNGGQNWALVGQSLARTSVRRLRVDANDANILSVASARAGSGRDGTSIAPPRPATGVLRSADGGITWSVTLAGQATALEVDPTNSSRQYAAIADQFPGFFNNEPTPARNGIYRSTNGGVSWSRIDGPWGPEPAEANRSAVGRVELALAPSNPNVMYASIQIPPNGGSNSNGLLGLYRTDDAWSDRPNWIQISTQATGSGAYCGPIPGEEAHGTGRCGSNHVISVDPREATTLFAGGWRDVWRCTNCGASPTWTNTTSSQRRLVFVHVDFHVLEWAGNRLITGNDGGVYSTADLGATWQSHNQTLTTNMFYMGALHPTDATFIVGAARDYSLLTHRTSTGWRTVQPFPSSLTGGEGEMAISSSRPDADWMAVRPSLRGIFRTTDGGRTFLQVDGGIDKAGAAFIAPVRKCPKNDDVFLAGTTRLWRTNNLFGAGTPAWTANSPSNEPTAILSIGFANGEPGCDTYAYGTRFGAVRLTRDGGTTWTDIDPSKTLEARPINSVVFDPTNTNRVFVARSGYDDAAPNKPGHIFRTDNALASSPTWTRMALPNVPFADMPFNVIVIDPRDTRLVYAGSDNGLWRSTDGGGSWVKVGRESGLPPVSIYDIQINPTTNRTVIFTHGRGAFELAR